GVPSVLSTASSSSIEAVAEASGDGERWFQLYWPSDSDVCANILRRARAAGFSTLVVTLDTWTLGWRPCDLDQAYLPFLQGEGVAIPFSDSVFRGKLEKSPEEDAPTAILRWLTMMTGRDGTWDQLACLRAHWDGPIVLKGIQHVDDARRAAGAGMDGIIVSNHGGRQLDGALGALDALAPIVAAVGDRLDVLFDSGVRTGADALKALALGAKAVLYGRPLAYGLAHGGADGVRHVLRSFLGELDHTMALSGHRRLGELSTDALQRVQMRTWLIRQVARFVAADPGLRRLRSGGRVIAGVVVTLAVLIPTLLALGQSPVAVAPGVVVVLLSQLAVNEPARGAQVVTTLLLPVSATVSLSLATLLADRSPFGELAFVVVMFVATYARRF